VTLANAWVLRPLTGQPAELDWRVIPAVGGLAIGLALVERASPTFALGIAWLGFVTALALPKNGQPSPLDNATRLLGYATG